MTKRHRNGLQLAYDDIIRGGLDIVTDKTKIKNKPKAEQETVQPTAARFNKLFFVSFTRNGRVTQN